MIQEGENTVFEYNPPEPEPSLGGGRFAQPRGGAEPATVSKATEQIHENASNMSVLRNRRGSYETLGPPAAATFEPPEQKIAKLQEEVASLINMVEASGAKDGSNDAADVLGCKPSEVTEELKALEQRLTALAKDGPSAWHKGEGKADPGPMAMPGSLVSQLNAVAAGGGEASSSSASGDMTYELRYAPNVSAVAESSKVAALEAAVAEIEKQLGLPDPSCPFADLNTAVAELQKRAALLDTTKVETISQRVKNVMVDVDKVLEKKREIEGNSVDDDTDTKVGELYEFCHRWSLAASSLPQIVTRLRSLQELHQQSSSFSSRLQGLEHQQEDLLKLLENTNAAVKTLGEELQENMTIVRDSMHTLETKVNKALSPKA